MMMMVEIYHIDYEADKRYIVSHLFVRKNYIIIKSCSKT